jgi:hypothetical protein
MVKGSQTKTITHIHSVGSFNSLPIVQQNLNHREPKLGEFHLSRNCLLVALANEYTYIPFWPLQKSLTNKHTTLKINVCKPWQPATTANKENFTYWLGCQTLNPLPPPPYKLPPTAFLNHLPHMWALANITSHADMISTRPPHIHMASC